MFTSWLSAHPCWSGLVACSCVRVRGHPNPGSKVIPAQGQRSSWPGGWVRGHPGPGSEVIPTQGQRSSCPGVRGHPDPGSEVILAQGQRAHESDANALLLLCRPVPTSAASSTTPSMKCVFAGCIWAPSTRTHATTTPKAPG